MSFYLELVVIKKFSLSKSTFHDVLIGFQLYYECSTTGCQRIDSGENIKEKNVLLLRRTQQTVRAISKRTAYEKWVFLLVAYFHFVNCPCSNFVPWSLSMY